MSFSNRINTDELRQIISQKAHKINLLYLSFLYTIGLKRNDIRYIPRFISIKMNENNTEEISLARELRGLWIIDELNYIKKHDNQILCVYGEISSIDTIKIALKKGINVKVIFGNELAKSNKEGLENLVDTEQTKLHLYSLPSRPENHWVLIGRHILFENKHAIGTSYRNAMTIEYASPELIRSYKNKFNMMISGVTELNKSQIKSMPTYDDTPNPSKN